MEEHHENDNKETESLKKHQTEVVTEWKMH